MNWNHHWKMHYAVLDFFGKEIDLINFLLAIGAIVIGLIWLIVLIVFLVKNRKKAKKKNYTEYDDLKKAKK